MNSSATAERSHDGSRFEDWSRRSAALLMAVVAVVIAVGLAVGSPPEIDTSGVPDSKTDTALYQAIITRVEAGQDYYSAATIEQRDRGYPLRPAMTMREPTLTYAAVAVGGVEHLRIVLFAIGAATGLALLLRLEAISGGRVTWWIAAALTALCSVAIFAPRFVVVHEGWASLFIALSLLARRPDKSAIPSVTLGVLAAATREIAFPFMIVMALLAWREGKVREFRQWCIGGVLFLGLYAAHYGLVLSHTTSQDPPSQGWLRFGGWPFDLSTVEQTTLLSLLPFWLTAIVVPLMLLGWASRKDEFSSRVLGTLCVFFVIFAFIGRTENWYWGILYAPFTGAGLAFAPSAVKDLFGRVFCVERTLHE